jgi:hypothetical protein
MVFFVNFEAFAQPSEADPKGAIVASVPSMRADGTPSCVEDHIQSLSLQSDFTPFMHRNCASSVRLKALRQLWRLLPQPTIALDSAV